MPNDVWIEWQLKWQTDPWGERRADLRNGMLISHLYRAMYGSVGRVIAMFAEEDKFDYDALPDYTMFMPYLDPSERHDPGANRYDAPFDPNQMTEEDFEAMFRDVGMWQAFLGGVDPSVRIVHVETG